MDGRACLNVTFKFCFLCCIHSWKTNMIFYAWFKPHAFLNTKYGIDSDDGIACLRKKKKCLKTMLNGQYRYDLFMTYKAITKRSAKEQKKSFCLHCSTQFFKNRSYTHIFMCSFNEFLMVYLVSRVKCFHVLRPSQFSK